MKKAKKPAKGPTSRAAKKTPLTKKKSAPVAKANKKKAAPKATAKKAAGADKKKVAASAKKPALKKAEPKAAKGILAKAKKAVEKAATKVAATVAPTAAVKGKKADAPKKAEKAEKVKKPAAEERPAEAEAQAATEENFDDAEVYLTDADGRRYCRVKDCDQVAMVDAYCRYHYLLFWKKIQVRKKILTEGKLERYIEELTARYPDKYLEMLRKDLRTEKDFLAAIAELEIDESAVDSDYEDEAQGYLDEVRGHTSESGSERDEEGF